MGSVKLRGFGFGIGFGIGIGIGFQRPDPEVRRADGQRPDPEVRRADGQRVTDFRGMNTRAGCNAGQRRCRSAPTQRSAARTASA